MANQCQSIFFQKTLDGSHYPLCKTNGGDQVHLGTIVHKADNAIHRISRYPADEC